MAKGSRNRVRRTLRGFWNWLPQAIGKLIILSEKSDNYDNCIMLKVVSQIELILARI